jgi:Fe-S cluster assembly protein SufD
MPADGALIRNETELTMAGEEGNGYIAAGVMGRDHALIDNTVYIRHEAAHCESRQVVKNVMDGDSKAVFQGKIYVKKDAQKTDGYQISQSVLLSERAEFNAKPELEIYADDVMCSHGSTTGALDETALFYLRSRGVPEKEAEAMLVAAFVDEAVLEIADEGLQDIVRASIDAWMAERAAG